MILTIFYIAVAVTLFYLTCDLGVGGPVRRYIVRSWNGERR